MILYYSSIFWERVSQQPSTVITFPVRSTIFMHWLMRKFVDTDAKLEATRRERHERGEARSVTLRGDDVRSWNKSRDRDLRNGGSSLTGSLSLALPLRHVRAAANKH